MKVLSVYGRIYADCFRQALLGIRKNAWTLLLPALLLVAWSYAGSLVAMLGLAGNFVGGIVLSLAIAAVLSCYLYFVGEVVAKSTVRLAEFQKSIGAYFWSVVNLTFVIWVAGMVLDLVVGRSPQAPVFNILFALAVIILLNAAPEVIYQRGTRGGLETVQRSIQFLQANWIEWALPTALPIALYLYFPLRELAVAWGLLGYWLGMVLEGALLHLAMVFRGHLFAALDGTSHRQRMYRWRSSTSA
jgi:hypothetical protein